MIKISSVNGQEGQAGQSNHSSAKAVDLGFTKALAQEGARAGITVNAVCPGHCETGDAGLIDGDGYLYIMARSDDVINMAGHRLSNGVMEEVLATHPDVAECAVIGDKPKGQPPPGLVCLNAGATRTGEEIERDCVALVRQEIGPVAAFETCVVVDALPRTRSGKILRGTMVAIADGPPGKMPATIDDAAVLNAIAERIGGLGAQIS